MTKIKDTEAALLQFEGAAINHAEATERGDYKVANKNYLIIAKVFKILKEQNEILRLTKFLGHSSDGVKGWAATYLLPLKEREAIQALEDIAKGSGIRSLAAETTLNEWRKGTLKF